jgi:hypothetical protein
MTDRNGDTIIVHYKNIDDKTESNAEQTNEELNKQHVDVQDKLSQNHQEALNDEAQKKVVETFLSGSDCLTGVDFKNIKSFIL